MSVTLVLVASVNGHITNGVDSSIYACTSSEDQKYFFGLIKSHPVIIMGKNTYIANKDVIKLEANKLRIVLTSDPEKYSSETVTGQLEFSREKPRGLLSRLHREKQSDILVVGGSKIASLFLNAGVIDRLLLTLEPTIFGQGLPMLDMCTVNTPMQLEEVKQLNKKGTLLLSYRIDGS